MIWRHSRDLDAVKWAQAISQQLPEQKRGKPLHFSALDHPQRVMALNALSGKPFRIISVMADKTALSPELYPEKNQLYYTLCRTLIERISWFCRDARKDVPEGDGKVKIVFSRRGGMSYDDFRRHLRSLRLISDSDVDINWAVIDVDSVEAYDPASRYGLQLADLAVSGLTWGVEPDHYGNCELRYARILASQVYSRKGRRLGHGIVLVHDEDRLTLSAQQLDFIRFFEGD